jgi:hypothetical protein
MAILKNQEIWFSRLVPARPDKNKLNPEKPNWSVQCRTTSKEVRKEWVSLGISPRTVREDPTDDESPVKYYSVSFRKNAFKGEGKDRVKADAPEVVDGKHKPVDPGSIGNGTIANLKLFKREYEVGGIKKISYVLMGVQVVKHVVYVSSPMEDFDDCETETVLPASEGTGEAGDDGDLY